MRPAAVQEIAALQPVVAVADVAHHDVVVPLPALVVHLRDAMHTSQ